jgi:hypothetical protein
MLVSWVPREQRLGVCLALSIYMYLCMYVSGALKACNALMSAEEVEIGCVPSAEYLCMYTCMFVCTHTHTYIQIHAYICYRACSTLAVHKLP